MFCAQCGAKNGDNNYRCTTCGSVLVRTPETGGQEPVPAGLASAIVVTIFCCWPIGIPAIVYAAQTMGHNSAGQFEAARETAKKAKAFKWWSFGLGFGVFVLYVAASFAGVMTP